MVIFHGYADGIYIMRSESFSYGISGGPPQGTMMTMIE